MFILLNLINMVGPTGLRIGLATAKGIAQSIDKKIIGVSALEAAAYAVPYSQGLICSVIDALRGQVFGTIYEWQGFELKQLIEPGLYDISEYINIALSHNKDLVAVNDGAALLEKELFENPHYHKLHRITTMPKASNIGLVALRKMKNNEYDDVDTLSPLYMRKSAAEEREG